MNSKIKASLIFFIAAILFLIPGCDCGKGGGNSATSTSDSISIPPQIDEPVYDIDIDVKTKEYGSENGTVNEAIERAYSSVYELKASSSALKVLGSAVAVFNGVITSTDENGDEVIENYTYFATCLSVISGATDFVLTSPVGESTVAEFVGADPSTDIAVLSIPGYVQTVEFVDDSNKVRLTDEMFVVGIPFNAGAGVVKNTYLGAKEHDVIINSNNRRLMTVSDELNEGYTGGAVYIKNGGVFAGMVAHSGNVSTKGFTFVVPSNVVLSIATALATTQSATTYGYVEGSFYLGAVFRDSKMSSSSYVYIASIDTTGCFYKGGLRELDKITRVAYIPAGENEEHSFIDVTTSSQLVDYIKDLELEIGDVLFFKCIRGGLSTMRNIEIVQYIYGEVVDPDSEEKE